MNLPSQTRPSSTTSKYQYIDSCRERRRSSGSGDQDVRLVIGLDIRLLSLVGPSQSATAARCQALTKRVRGFFTASEGTYGYRRIHADLADEGTECSPALVRQIMRNDRLIACQPRPFRITTDADAETATTMLDLVGRNFTAERPGIKFVGDITYIHTWAGFVYVATVIDCYSRKVVGWSMADHMRTELVENALKNAAVTTIIEPLAVLHSDRGSVYTSADYRALVKDLGMRSSRDAPACAGTVSLFLPGSARIG